MSEVRYLLRRVGSAHRSRGITITSEDWNVGMR